MKQKVSGDVHVCQRCGRQGFAKKTKKNKNKMQQKMDGVMYHTVDSERWRLEGELMIQRKKVTIWRWSK